MNGLRKMLPEDLIIVIVAILMYMIMYRTVRISKKPSSNSAKKWIFNFEIKSNGLLHTAFVPFIIVALIVLSYIYLGSPPVTWEGEDSILLFIYTVILAPYGEEILFRAVIFGVFISISESLKTNLKRIVVIIGWLSQAVIFMYFHRMGFQPDMMLMGLVYGGFFYFYKRNLLPSVVGHSTSNLIVFLLTSI